MVLRVVPGRLRRLVFNAFIVVTIAAFAVAGASLVILGDIGQQSRVENCRAINELSREIYVFLGEVNVPDYQRDKFLPTRDCESLP